MATTTTPKTDAESATAEAPPQPAQTPQRTSRGRRSGGRTATKSARAAEGAGAVTSLPGVPYGRIVRKEIEFAGRQLIVETGKIAGQANGAVTLQYGDTVILATA
ncbi:MAG: hypothetical protein ACRDJN_15760, partial [Chloroflexota bacterium]